MRSVVLIAFLSFVALAAVIFCIVLYARNKKFLTSVSADKEAVADLKAELAKSKQAELEKDSTISSLSKDVSELSEKLSTEQEASKAKAESLNSALAELESAKSDIQNKNAELEKARMDIQNQDDKMKFIADIINAQPVELPAMQEFKKLLSTDYMEFAKENDSLADEAGALLKLQEVERQLELFSYDEAIAKKTIVAVAGSFSSGKSSFMNSFFSSRKVKLPTGMTQTTAIPSYVLVADAPSITGYSYKGGKIAVSEKIFILFSHERIHEFSFNMKQLVHNIIFRNKFVHEFKNLCFIDTPGFNPGIEQESDTDAATTAISTASVLLWCVDTCAGTIKDDEIDILCDIYKKNENIAIYVIVNKADLRSVEEIESVMDEIESQLQNADIPFEGISAYSSSNIYSQQPEELAGLVRGVSLSDFLASKDVENNQKETLLLSLVKDVFDAYIQADKARIEKLERQIKTFDALQESFTQQLDLKDDIILKYKAQRDRTYEKKITRQDGGGLHAQAQRDGKHEDKITDATGKNYETEQNNETEENDEIEENDKMFIALSEIRADYQETIKKDKRDIAAAEELCTKMQKCISDLFGHE